MVDYITRFKLLLDQYELLRKEYIEFHCGNNTAHKILKKFHACVQKDTSLENKDFLKEVNDRLTVDESQFRESSAKFLNEMIIDGRSTYDECRYDSLHNWCMVLRQTCDHEYDERNKALDMIRQFYKRNTLRNMIHQELPEDEHLANIELQKARYRPPPTMVSLPPRIFGEPNYTKPQPMCAIM